VRSDLLYEHIHPCSLKLLFYFRTLVLLFQCGLVFFVLFVSMFSVLLLYVFMLRTFLKIACRSCNLYCLRESTAVCVSIHLHMALWNHPVSLKYIISIIYSNVLLITLLFYKIEVIFILLIKACVYIMYSIADC
jgi:hypothetical protein